MNPQPIFTIKHLCTLLLAVIPICMWAQVDAYHTGLLGQLQTEYGLSGGSWLLSDNEVRNANNATSYGHTNTVSSISGQVFSQNIRMEVAATGSNPWDAAYFNSNLQPLGMNDVALLVLWLRTAPSSPNPGKLSIFIENSSSFAKEIYLTLSPDSQWQQYLIPIQSSASYAPQELNIGFHLAYNAQILEMGGMTMINYGQTVSYSQLPQELNQDNYQGSDPAAPWRSAAAARIEQHRKADMKLTIQDPQGNPLSNQSVRVEMLRHDFAFGTAVVPRKLAGNTDNDPIYASKLLDLDEQGHGFNWVVTENALKWRAWEQGWAGSPAETVNAIQWLNDRQIQVRGHVLVWPGWTRMPNDMQTNSNDPTYMLNRINGHLDQILNYAGIRDRVLEWDVINEIAHVRDLENALQSQAGYPTGREIYPQILNQALLEDPRIITYVNDYNILSNGSVNGGDYQLFKSMIQEILDAGSPLDGIGFQAHMGSNLIAPDSLYAILEDCYQSFGKTIKITEYDQDSIIDDETAAQYTGDFLTMIFSHPAVDGFLMWGFWDGAHWRGNAPLYHADWSPKPALTSFNQLVFNEWWTDTMLTTDALGQVDLRAFKGDYSIQVGTDLTATLSLDAALDTTLRLTATGLDPFQMIQPVRLHPNPAKDQLFLELPYPSQWRLSLGDLMGKTWFADEFEGKNHRIDFPKIPSGMYMIHLQDDQGKKVSRKVVKE